MTSLIEFLNHWGDQAVNFAWPMLWQSSLLFALVLVLDLLLAHKIRAAVRYALWLAVLVKLLLPPALALPTGAAWWLFPIREASVAPTPKYTVTYDQTPAEMAAAPQAVLIKLAPTLNRSGWMLLASIVASAGFLLWLGCRWWQITRLVRAAADSDQFSVLVDEARHVAGLRGVVRFKLVESRMSPAVCGLFRPVILLPRALAEKLSPAQLRAVLLHEMIHLRRGDVWVNCAQALLQIVYWWHPLLWVANGRIRRIREEAVDDMVMLALCDEADGYAPTLLEVAKLALHRPLVSLGLIGIMESRSALRQRVERLMDFRAPRKAGLTFVSLCGVFVFSAVALPMGQAPVAENSADPVALGAASSSPRQSLTLNVNPDVFIRNLEAWGSNSLFVTTGKYSDALISVLRSEGVDCVPPNDVKFNARTGEITAQNTPEQLEIFRQIVRQLNRPDGIFDTRMITFNRKSILIEARFFWMQSADLAKLSLNLKFNPGQDGLSSDWTVAARQFDDLNQRIQSLGLKPFMRPRVLTSHGIPAQFYCETETNGVEFDFCPLVIPEGIQLAYKAGVTGLARGSGQGLAGTTHFVLQGMDATEDHGGMVLRANDPNGSSSNLVMVLSMQEVTNASHYAQRLQPVSKLTGTNAAANSNSPVLALIEAGKEVVLPGSHAVLNVKTREGNAIRGIRLVTHNGRDSVITAETGEVEAGLDDDSVWITLYNATINRGTVRNDVGKLRMLLAEHARPEVRIKAWFVKAAGGTTLDLGGLFSSTNGAAGKQVTGILNETNTELTLRAMESRKDFEILAEPEGTTMTGRQMQMRATQVIQTVTNFALEEQGTNASIVPQTGPVETGPILDVVPYVLADGYSIVLSTTASMINFLGYEKTTNTATAYNRAGDAVEVPKVLPKFSTCSMSTSATVRDGQTLILATTSESQVAGEDSTDPGRGEPGSKEQNQQILVFITTTLVDSAGNRVHSANELAALGDRIAPQTPQ